MCRMRKTSHARHAGGCDRDGIDEHLAVAGDGDHAVGPAQHQGQHRDRRQGKDPAVACPSPITVVAGVRGR